MSGQSDNGQVGAPSGAPPLAVLDGVRKSFGATLAVADVSLAINAGQSHALVGRNGAGKSTVVAMLTGLIKPDSGQILFNDEPAPALSDRKGWQERVACVYQRPTVVPELTVAENIFLNDPVGDRNLISWRETRRRARKELDGWEMNVDVDMLARDLPVDQRQVVEIIRALSRGSRLIVLDEPTSQLEARGIKQFFERIKRLQDAGVTFLYISHHLSEIPEICDFVTVLRDGHKVGEGLVEDWPDYRMVKAMVGRDDAQSAASAGSGRPSGGSMVDQSSSRISLKVSGLTLENEYDDVSLTVRSGECVGLAGLVGSGKNAFAESIAGLRRPSSGEIEVDGKPLNPGNVRRSINAGVGFVPEDRHHSGFVSTMTVAENLTLSLANLGQAGWARPAALTKAATALIDDLSIKAAAHDEASSLSGGNQQKIVLGRAMSTQPKVLVLVHPTAGVDIASKDVIFDVVNQARQEGLAVLLVSDELDELDRCDRVLVMFGGRVVSEFKSEWDRNELVAAIEGVSSE